MLSAYLISAPVRLFMFDNRIEIISPGHPPNNLTVEKIRTGNSNLRNPVLASYVAKGLLPYRGLGSGIKRALEEWPDIDFVDDRAGCLFTATVQRKERTELARQFLETSEGVNAGVNTLLTLVERHPGLRAPALAKELNTSVKNLERWLKQLKDSQRIEFRGAPKTGGYYPGQSHECREQHLLPLQGGRSHATFPVTGRELTLHAIALGYYPRNS